AGGRPGRLPRALGGRRGATAFPLRRPCLVGELLDDVLQLADGELADLHQPVERLRGYGDFPEQADVRVPALLLDLFDDLDGPVVLGGEGADLFDAVGVLEVDVDELGLRGGGALGAHLLEADDLAVGLGHGGGSFLGGGRGGGWSGGLSCRPRPGIERDRPPAGGYGASGSS